ncbi:MAG: type II toxin-antitoxin system Phd/YefM family antitoxin [Sphingomonadales bacterium]|nr:MAG: type II toxin-antitoxin system Phd/YefM family antitoxin [Sphingomonadales bacterium]
MRVVSSREFNQDVSAVKRLARLEPVFVTDRGRPTHVLLSIDAFRQLSGERENLVDLLAMPSVRSDAEPPAAESWDWHERL